MRGSNDASWDSDELPSQRKRKFGWWLRIPVVCILVIVAALTNPSHEKHKQRIVSAMTGEHALNPFLAGAANSPVMRTQTWLLVSMSSRYQNFFLFSTTSYFECNPATVGIFGIVILTMDTKR